ncbi:hypothetical protein SEA_ALLEB_18 [Microbacterium phage Alleb]|nr:hypothetical protein SEA_ALLEB_18 [Microbacterium phage Alleb]
MKFPHHRITAAARVVHNNYSDVDVFEAEIGELIWAEGTVRAMIEKLGDSDEMIDLRRRNSEVRRFGLEQGRALSRLWEALVGSEQPETASPTELADRIVLAVQDEARQIEITDDMVNSVALGAFGPAVVYDREGLRRALADALQTR